MSPWCTILISFFISFFQLENTDDIDERRELRRQIRELRNKKFDEEMKKISSGEISASSVTNGSATRKSIKKVESIEDSGDPYGLLEYNDEETLQELVSFYKFYFDVVFF
jgi:hypothetical protein